MSANVHEFAGRDRWYKKKAHATEEDTNNCVAKDQLRRSGVATKIVLKVLTASVGKVIPGRSLKKTPTLV
jgi:hypothetical protein